MPNPLACDGFDQIDPGSAFITTPPIPWQGVVTGLSSVSGRYGGQAVRGENSYAGSLRNWRRNASVAGGTGALNTATSLKVSTQINAYFGSTMPTVWHEIMRWTYRGQVLMRLTIEPLSTTSALLGIRNNANVLLASGGSILIDQWHNIGTAALIQAGLAPTDTFEVYIDGVSAISYGPINIPAPFNAGANLTHIDLIWPRGVGAGFTVYDDYVQWEPGAAVTFSDVWVQTLKANGDLQNGWNGFDFANVGVAPPHFSYMGFVNDLGRIQTNVPGNTTRFTLDDLTDNPLAIYGVQWWYPPVGGTGTGTGFLRLSGVDTAFATGPLAGNIYPGVLMHLTAPGGAAWTKANINALEWGLTSTNNASQNTSFAGIMVVRDPGFIATPRRRVVFFGVDSV